MTTIILKIITQLAQLTTTTKIIQLMSSVELINSLLEISKRNTLFNSNLLCMICILKKIYIDYYL